MKELQSIIDASQELERTNTPAALATVVRVTGSAYRRPGARMLIAANGHTVGSVSGGCLERDVVNQARRVLQGNDARVVTYDSMSDDDLVLEFNLGCSGIVDVLIEPFPHHGERGHMTFLADCLRDRQVGVLATVFAVEGRTTAAVGDRVMLREQHPARYDIEDSDLAEAIVRDARCALASGTSRTHTYELAAGRTDVFIEVVQPPVPLVIFGAGHDAVPLVRIAQELGWHVTLVDPRPGYATRMRFPSADALIACRPDEVSEQVTIDARTMAVIMTHNMLHDSALLRTLLPSPLRYLGLLGPTRRRQRLLDEIQEHAGSLSDHLLARVYGPVGLDIGADTPEEIALAVAAEIQAVLSGRLGGFLRSRESALHEPSPVETVAIRSGTINGVLSCGQERY
ncbi:MAG: XdhC family protein [Nitrospira sp.]|nr:MAG: XdhC family protein [Nitrospira sp.]